MDKIIYTQMSGFDVPTRDKIYSYKQLDKSVLMPAHKHEENNDQVIESINQHQPIECWLMTQCLLAHEV